MSDQSLDITHEVCPMTYVRVKLALERLAPGQLLRVRLRGAEPLRAVPESLRDDGQQVVSLDIDAQGIGTLVVRRMLGGV